LLEAILALLFITLGVGAAAGLFSNSMAKVRQVQLRTRAMLLAESMLAEFQTGLIDITEGQSGDFDGKPTNFFWEIEQEDTQVSELKRLKISISYDDPADGFTYTVYRLYSPSLNLSAEQMKEISTDPVQMQALGGSNGGLQDLFEMCSEFQFGDQIVNALLRGGVPGMMKIYNKVLSGKISPEELLALAGGESSETTPLEGMMVEGSEEGTSAGSVWSDYDTAGIGEKPSSGESSSEVASADEPADPDKSDETPATQPARADTGGDKSNEGLVTRDEAIKRMQEMLRRLADKPK
jgi:hypothetical protein